MNLYPDKNQLRPSSKDSDDGLTTAQMAFATVVGQALADLWHRQSRDRSTNVKHSALHDAGTSPTKP